MGAGLLLSARRVLARDKRVYTQRTGELQQRMDSLYGKGYLDRRIRRLTAPLASSGNPRADSVRSDVASLDQQHDSASARLVVLYLEGVPKRDAATLALILADTLFVLVIALLLSVLWVWFGGRTPPPGPAPTPGG